ncbi:hypothetical protein [Mesorhizobium sp. M8A.F.Ca.ET.021.01.1.1]|uniref:hypothetical protein n=1 Tax=Mesorhizobium sp. M8A.F.Ca.ET.021.01.1.1 TaxID=2496757 RepID=UPI000FCC017F|nr:hypothetical protein [Mesorhizobium sp. M8A.F.Ca.ET.021.01.1.1]RUW56827.1 hypothetical protein EOA36_02185 [Mesorhizobium sp. M8A.F.Ca.ET.021.01.1.1]
MTDTIEKTDQQIIDETVAAHNLTGKVWCFMAGMHPHPRLNTYLLGIATLGEAGWSPMPRMGFETFGEANDRADSLNTLLPYSADTCIAIIADTMSRSRLKQEQEEAARHPFDRHYKVKVSFMNEGRANLHEDDISDAIRERLVDEDGATFGIDDVEVDLK